MKVKMKSKKRKMLQKVGNKPSNNWLIRLSNQRSHGFQSILTLSIWKFYKMRTSKKVKNTSTQENLIHFSKFYKLWCYWLMFFHADFTQMKQSRFLITFRDNTWNFLAQTTLLAIPIWSNKKLSATSDNFLRETQSLWSRLRSLLLTQ